MVCSHPAFRLSFSDEQKQRILALAKLLEKKMSLRPGHPAYLAKQRQANKQLSEAEREEFRRAVAESGDAVANPEEVQNQEITE